MTLNMTERATVRDAIGRLNQVPAEVPYSWAASEARDLLRSLDGVKTADTSESSSVPQDDSLTKLLADMESKSVTGNFVDRLAKRLRALLDDCATEPENPEVIRGSEVADLPDGSLVVACERDGSMKAGTTIRRSTEAPFYADWYLVAHRAHEKPVNVGDVITGQRADKLPQDSIVQRHSGMYPLIKAVTGWRMGPSEAPFHSLATEYGTTTTFRVLSIGGK